MIQVISKCRSGATGVIEIPASLALAGHSVRASVASAISACTERYVIDLARKSLISKARQRPVDVKRLLQKLRQEGVLTTITQVFTKLDGPMARAFGLEL